MELVEREAAAAAARPKAEYAPGSLEYQALHPGAAPLDADSGWRAPPMKLTPKQARFVQEYLIDLNAAQAAIRAGYSAKTARVMPSAV